MTESKSNYLERRAKRKKRLALRYKETLAYGMALAEKRDQKEQVKRAKLQEEDKAKLEDARAKFVKAEQDKAEQDKTEQDKTEQGEELDQDAELGTEKVKKGDTKRGRKGKKSKKDKEVDPAQAELNANILAAVEAELGSSEYGSVDEQPEKTPPETKKVKTKKRLKAEDKTPWDPERWPKQKARLWRTQTSGKRAFVRLLPIPASKARLRLRGFVGLTLEEAIFRLQCSPSLSARYFLKLVLSLAGNIIHGPVKDSEEGVIKDYKISEIQVFEGPRYKRHHPISKGAAQAILKRSCRVRIVADLSEKALFSRYYDYLQSKKHHEKEKAKEKEKGIIKGRGRNQDKSKKRRKSHNLW
jgi:hypothetical protein